MSARPPAALVRGLLVALALAAGGGGALAADSAVVLQYHRFGEDALPTTSVTIDQLGAHIDHLASGGYAVLPLPEILAALRAGRPLPERAVAITIDDAARSVVDEAWPRFAAAGMPFTVFVSTDAVDQGHAGIMDWDDLRRLAAAGVTIGNHGAAHGRMWRDDADANRADLLRARRRIAAELGVEADLFAYPYGEWNEALRGLVAELGFSAAFGQQSGVVHRHSDAYNLPRFPLNEAYGELERFALVVDALPLAVTALTPAEPVLAENPPTVGFTVLPPLPNLAALGCYASGDVTTRVESRGDGAVAVRFDQPFPPGRGRLNCTLREEGGRWRWFGLQFFVPDRLVPDALPGVPCVRSAEPPYRPKPSAVRGHADAPGRNHPGCFDG